MESIPVSSLTPAMKQYAHIKEKYADCILFFRMGDFYETFGKDAEITSRELGIALTSRNRGKDRIPLAGIPYHAIDNYLPRMIKKGYKIAICEQVEDPKLAKGIVKREVVRVITPGTIVEQEYLNADVNNYLCAMVSENKRFGVAFVDCSTGEFFTTELSGSDSEYLLLSELLRFNPAECIIPQTMAKEKQFVSKLSEYLKNTMIHTYEDIHFESSHAYDTLAEHFGLDYIKNINMKELQLSMMSAGAVLDYLKDTQKQSLSNIVELKTYSVNEFMLIDNISVRNLELVRNIRDGSKKNTLLDVLDHCITPMGSRTLKKWILQPLMDKKKIEDRLNAVEIFCNNIFLLQDIRKILSGIVDIERLNSKVVYERANARDLLTLKDALKKVPELKKIFYNYNVKSELLNVILTDIHDVSEITEIIEKGIKDDPNVTLRDGNLIKDGYSKELDMLRDLSLNGKKWISELEKKERERTGIKNLRVGYNQVFGYYIEITRSYLSHVPKDYIRKQTLVNAERFVTPELKDRETQILNAEEKIKTLEYELFIQIRKKVSEKSEEILKIANAIGIIDTLQSFANVAVRNKYTKPIIVDDDKISIKGGRHPVVEQTCDFIPNDTLIDTKDKRMIILTGPNMSGKSTYMRQIALISIMAQSGSFVPARYASLPIVDRVLTRVGAFDDLVSGQSTFMVEMTELSNILRTATKKSLILLDEIGRGTSTFDGLSIAWAVAEYIHNTIKCKTIFATHYHQLTELENMLRGVKNMHVAVKEDKKNIIFLRKVIPGGTDKSYGVHVGKLAGLPRTVLSRANEILNNLEQTKIDIIGNDRNIPKISRYTQIVFSSAEDNKEHPILRKLKEINVDNITPVEAIVKLKELQNEINEE